MYNSLIPKIKKKYLFYIKLYIKKLVFPPISKLIDLMYFTYNKTFYIFIVR